MASEVGLTGWGRGKGGGGGARLIPGPSNQQGAAAAWEENYECSCQRLIHWRETEESGRDGATGGVGPRRAIN